MNMYNSILQTVHLYNVVVAHVFHREPPRPWWSTAIAVVHRDRGGPPWDQFPDNAETDTAIRHGEITVFHGVSRWDSNCPLWAESRWCVVDGRNRARRSVDM